MSSPPQDQVTEFRAALGVAPAEVSNSEPTEAVVQATIEPAPHQIIPDETVIVPAEAPIALSTHDKLVAERHQRMKATCANIITALDNELSEVRALCPHSPFPSDIRNVALSDTQCADFGKKYITHCCDQADDRTRSLVVTTEAADFFTCQHGATIARTPRYLNVTNACMGGETTATDSYTQPGTDTEGVAPTSCIRMISDSSSFRGFSDVDLERGLAVSCYSTIMGRPIDFAHISTSSDDAAWTLSFCKPGYISLGTVTMTCPDIDIGKVMGPAPGTQMAERIARNKEGLAAGSDVRMSLDTYNFREGCFWQLALRSAYRTGGAPTMSAKLKLKSSLSLPLLRIMLAYNDCFPYNLSTRLNGLDGVLTRITTGLQAGPENAPITDLVRLQARQWHSGGIKPVAEDKITAVMGINDEFQSRFDIVGRLGNANTVDVCPWMRNVAQGVGHLFHLNGDHGWAHVQQGVISLQPLIKHLMSYPIRSGGNRNNRTSSLWNTSLALEIAVSRYSLDRHDTNPESVAASLPILRPAAGSDDAGAVQPNGIHWRPGARPNRQPAPPAPDPPAGGNVPNPPPDVPADDGVAFDAMFFDQADANLYPMFIWDGDGQLTPQLSFRTEQQALLQYIALLVGCLNCLKQIGSNGLDGFSDIENASKNCQRRSFSAVPVRGHIRNQLRTGTFDPANNAEGIHPNEYLGILDAKLGVFVTQATTVDLDHIQSSEIGHTLFQGITEGRFRIVASDGTTPEELQHLKTAAKKNTLATMGLSLEAGEIVVEKFGVVKEANPDGVLDVPDPFRTINVYSGSESVIEIPSGAKRQNEVQMIILLKDIDGCGTNIEGTEGQAGRVKDHYQDHLLAFARLNHLTEFHSGSGTFNLNPIQNLVNVHSYLETQSLSYNSLFDKEGRPTDVFPRPYFYNMVPCFVNAFEEGLLAEDAAVKDFALNSMRYMTSLEIQTVVRLLRGLATRRIIPYTTAVGPERQQTGEVERDDAASAVCELPIDNLSILEAARAPRPIRFHSGYAAIKDNGEQPEDGYFRNGGVAGRIRDAVGLDPRHPMRESVSAHVNYRGGRGRFTPATGLHRHRVKPLIPQAYSRDSARDHSSSATSLDNIETPPASNTRNGFHTLIGSERIQTMYNEATNTIGGTHRFSYENTGVFSGHTCQDEIIRLPRPTGYSGIAFTSAIEPKRDTSIAMTLESSSSPGDPHALHATLPSAETPPDSVVVTDSLLRSYELMTELIEPRIKTALLKFTEVCSQNIVRDFLVPRGIPLHVNYRDDASTAHITGMTNEYLELKKQLLFALPPVRCNPECQQGDSALTPVGVNNIRNRFGSRCPSKPEYDCRCVGTLTIRCPGGGQMLTPHSGCSPYCLPHSRGAFAFRDKKYMPSDDMPLSDKSSISSLPLPLVNVSMFQRVTLSLMGPNSNYQGYRKAPRDTNGMLQKFNPDATVSMVSFGLSPHTPVSRGDALAARQLISTARTSIIDSSRPNPVIAIAKGYGGPQYTSRKQSIGGYFGDFVRSTETLPCSFHSQINGLEIELIYLSNVSNGLDNYIESLQYVSYEPQIDLAFQPKDGDRRAGYSNMSTLLTCDYFTNDAFLHSFSDYDTLRDTFHKRWQISRLFSDTGPTDPGIESFSYSGHGLLPPISFDPMPMLNSPDVGGH